MHSCAHADRLPPTPNTVTLGQLSAVLNQSRPHYFWDRGSVACAPVDDARPDATCCPAYCCNVIKCVPVPTCIVERLARRRLHAPPVPPSMLEACRLVAFFRIS